MGRRRKGRKIDGLLVLDKPAGITSNQALQRVKTLFAASKAGHTGSLDPLATGVLPLCFGEATKFSQFLLDADKGYRSQIILGVGTATGDAQGIIKKEVNSAHLDQATVESAIEGLTGEIQQVPPMYSAIKVNGQPLYKRARAGEEIERPSRRVFIHHFRLVKFVPGDQAEVTVDILCSKGTYIRALAEDFGEALGVPAHVATLRRIRSGSFDLSEAVSLQDLESAARAGVPKSLDTKLLSIESIIAHFPRLELAEAATFYLRKGQSVLVPNAPCSGMVRIADAEGKFLGIGKMQDDGRLAPKRLLAN